MKKLFVSAFFELRNLISTYRKTFLLSLFLFFVGISFILLIPDHSKMNFFLSMGDQIFTFNYEKQKLFSEILFNNLRVDLEILILSPLIIPPFFMAIEFGIPLGVVIDIIPRMTAIPGFKIQDALTSIIPHGLIELPTMILVQFLAILMALKMVFKGKIAPSQSRWNFFVKIFRVNLLILVPLIILAAIVESFISYSFVRQKSNQMLTIDPLLNRMIVNTDDLKKLGIDSQEVASNSDKDSVEFTFKTVGIYLYDKEITSVLKKNFPTKTETKLYKSNDVLVSFQVREYKNNDLEEQQKLFEDVYKALAKNDPSIKISEIDKGIFKIESNSKTSLIFVNYLKNYLYSVSLRGGDNSLFDKMIQLQKEKISKIITAN